MRLTDITPIELRCPIANCPAVYRDENGRLFIIGEDITTIPDELKGKSDVHERIIAIDQKFLKNITEFEQMAYFPEK